MAKVKRDEETGNHEVDSNLDNSKKQKKEDEETFIKQLVKKDYENFIIKRPYETA